MPAAGLPCGREEQPLRRHRTAFAPIVALVLSLSACSGAPAATEPIESEDVGTLTPAPPATTPHADATAPNGNVPPDSGNGRPAQLMLVLSGTSTQSDGSYSASGPARLCGNGVYNLTGSLTAFNFEFPLDGDFEIKDVTFSAEDLLPGATNPTFHIGVNVRAKLGGEPPATVVHTDLPGSGDTGSAARSESNGTTTLTVQGTNDFGETVSLTATCGPR